MAMRAVRGSVRWGLPFSISLSSSSSRRTVVGRRASSSWPGGGHGWRAVDMAAREGELRVFVVAGEVSGDSIAARLMAALRRLSPFPVRFSGVGGSLMSKEGLQSLFPMEDIAVMGIWELLPHLNKIRMKLRETAEAAISFQPHVVVTVDSKGFSFRLHRKLRAEFYSQQVYSPLHIHYVAPSFWAWKGGKTRLKSLSDFLDHVLCILPFEEEVCRNSGLAATFVGHPMLEDALRFKLDINPSSCKVQGSCEGFLCKHGLSSRQQSCIMCFRDCGHGIAVCKAPVCCCISGTCFDGVANQIQGKVKFYLSSKYSPGFICYPRSPLSGLQTQESSYCPLQSHQ